MYEEENMAICYVCATALKVGQQFPAQALLIQLKK